LGIYEKAYDTRNYIVLDVLGGLAALYTEMNESKKAADIKERMAKIFRS
jgi:hypothetical protein